MRTKTILVVGVVAVMVSVTLTVGVAVAEDLGHAAATVDGPLADHADPEPALAVAPQADGSAEIHVTYAFDLSDDARAEAFEEIRTNETVRTAFEERFRTRLSSVAADAAEETGREMTIQDVDLSIRTIDDTGIVEVSLTWGGLAAVEGDRLVITEPFASGFDSERPIHLLVPDGFTVESVSPTPADRDAGLLTWKSDTSLDGYEVRLKSTEEAGTGDTTAGENGPGFGVLATLVAVLAATGMARLNS